MNTRQLLGSNRWAIKWNGAIMWKNCLPDLFLTQKACSAQIKKEYGYIKTRKDLRNVPLRWRMPKAVKVEVILKEIKGGV